MNSEVFEALQYSINIFRLKLQLDLMSRHEISFESIDYSLAPDQGGSLLTADLGLIRGPEGACPFASVSLPLSKGMGRFLHLPGINIKKYLNNLLFVESSEKLGRFWEMPKGTGLEWLDLDEPAYQKLKAGLMTVPGFTPRYMSQKELSDYDFELYLRLEGADKGLCLMAALAYIADHQERIVELSNLIRKTFDRLMGGE